MQGFLMCALQCILTNIETNLTEDKFYDITDLITDIFRQRKDVFDEGLIVISALCNKFPNYISHKINDITPFIIHGIKSTNAAVLRNSCGVLSDFCTLMEDNYQIIKEGYESYMPHLIDHLKSESTDRSAKVFIITVIGDTFLTLKRDFKNYMLESLELLEQASILSVTVTKEAENDQEELKYLISLQSSLVECYTCFIQNI